MRELSVRAAAAERPDGIAVIDAERAWTWAEIAAEIGAGTGTGTGTVQTIYRQLEEGTPIVLSTSGSTGEPKAVEIAREAMLASARMSARNLGEREDDRWLLCLSTRHAGGLSVVIRALVARVPVIVHEGPFEPERVAALAVRHRATLASLVPTQLDRWLASGAEMPAWRAVLLGGAAAPRPVLERAAARGVPFLRTYGMTETFGQVATQRLADAGRIDAPVVPLEGVTIRGGTREAPGLLTIEAPTLTAPLVTSDLGWVDDGVHVVGRADDVIITGGENVHPAEVEAAVARAPGVAASCAFGVDDERWGQLVACAIVPAPGLDVEDLHAWLARHLPPHLRPRRLAVVDALPLLPTGKVDRRTLARMLAS